MAILTIRQAKRPLWFGLRHYALAAVVIVASAACGGPAETETAAVEESAEVSMPGIWPPPASPATDPSVTVPMLGSDPEDAEFCGDTVIYNDYRLTVVPEAEQRVGYVMCDGEFDLDYNIFEIPKAGAGFVNNIIEVTEFDDSHTRIRMNSDENHRLVYEVDKDALYAGRVDFIMTPIYAGTLVIYGDNVYEIKADGWYVDDQLVHSFGPAPAAF